MCFTSLYISVINLFTPSLQFIFLFCFYEMLKRLKRIIFFPVVLLFFLSDGIVIVFVSFPSGAPFLFLPCSVNDLWVVFRVSCTVKALYNCPSPLLSSGTKKKCLVQYVLLFVTTRQQKNKKKVKVEVAGGSKWGDGLQSENPSSALLASPPSRISNYIIILTFFFLYIVCTEEWEFNIGTRGLTR